MKHTECNEVMNLCEHADTALHLGKEVARKEKQIWRFHNRLHVQAKKLESMEEELTKKITECEEKDAEIKELKDQLSRPYVTALLARNRTDKGDLEETTAQATLSKRSVLSAIENSPKRRRESEEHQTIVSDYCECRCHAEDIECTISEGHWNKSCRGKTCIITKVSFPSCVVWIETSDTTTMVECDKLKPVQPKTTDKVKVLHGDDVGQTGELTSILTSIWRSDGVVRMDRDKRFKILPFKFLGKMSKD